MPRNIYIVALLLSAISIFAVVLDVRGTKAAKPLPVDNQDTIDRLVVDYAFTCLEAAGRQAVADCGQELVGQEVDVTARATVDGNVLVLSTVRFGTTGWAPELGQCVNKAFEGFRRPIDLDKLRNRIPVGAEYELDAHLAFAAPTLQYNP